MQKRGYAAVGSSHEPREVIRHVGRLDGGEPEPLDARPLEQAEKKPREPERVLRAPPPVVTEVDAREHDLVGAPGQGGAHLFLDSSGVEGAGAAAGLPDDAVRAAVVAAVLHLDAGARAARRRHRVPGVGRRPASCRAITGGRRIAS